MKYLQRREWVEGYKTYTMSLDDTYVEQFNKKFGKWFVDKNGNSFNITEEMIIIGFTGEDGYDELSDIMVYSKENKTPQGNLAETIYDWVKDDIYDGTCYDDTESNDEVEDSVEEVNC